ncbi:MAG TPA: hypothetical protein DEA73_02405 [Peptococcaceae bacterium]|nr:hypothetical protein [Peptococcaceae bacterium]
MLLAYSVLIEAGHPTPMDGQEVRWVPVKYLSSYELAEADMPIAYKLLTEGKEHFPVSVFEDTHNYSGLAPFPGLLLHPAW